MIRFLLACFITTTLYAQNITNFVVGTVVPTGTNVSNVVSGGGAGPNTWFNSSTGTPDGNLDASGPTYMEWMAVTVVTGGTANSLRIHVDHTGSGLDVDCKMALYDGANNLLITSSVTTIPGSISSSYVTFTIANTSISAGTYYVAFEGSLPVFISTISGANGPYKTQAYASFPPATLPAEDGHANSFLMGVFVQ